MTFYFHLRSQEQINSGKGGTTYAFKEEGNHWRVAAANCHYKDNFCRKTGRIKAEGRLRSSTQSWLMLGDSKKDIINQLVHFV